MSEEHRTQTRGLQNDDIRSCLGNLGKERDIVLLYTDKEQSQKFSAGIIMEIFDDAVIIGHYLPNGRYDGYIVKRIDDIYRIEDGSKYANKIQVLSLINGAKHDPLTRINEDAFTTVLYYAYETKRVVTIELFDSGNNDVTGLIERINEGYCTISMLNEYGESDGVSTFAIKNISHLSCDGDDENVIQQLHQKLNTE
jgi:hypothetical protein